MQGRENRGRNHLARDLHERFPLAREIFACRAVLSISAPTDRAERKETQLMPVREGRSAGRTAAALQPPMLQDPGAHSSSELLSLCPQTSMGAQARAEWGPP